MDGFLNNYNKSECFGCEACSQICPKKAIKMVEDLEGFRYPVVDEELCVKCGLCNKVCPYENIPSGSMDEKVVFGGYHNDITIRGESTSGGAFTAIVESWCDEEYVIFGAAADGLRVYHDYIFDKSQLAKFRKSKYSQSIIGNSYEDAKRFLVSGKKVLFSGTPCQIAGLLTYLRNVNKEKLLTIEVICEGVPSPLFVRKYDEYLKIKYGYSINTLDYRYKDMKPRIHPNFGKWDFQVMHTVLQNGKKLKRDRWLNPFWSIWLNHLMSRPSCYQCPFAKSERIADVTLGDLWGVHLYCPELYGRNSGASLVVCNTARGKEALKMAKSMLYGHELDFSTALKYQGPMRKAIEPNLKRDVFMKDLTEMEYLALCQKWAKRPTLKLLWSKYIWGNRQKIFFWNLKRKLVRNEKRKE